VIETWRDADDRLRLAGLLRHVLVGAGAGLVAGGVTAGILAWETAPSGGRGRGARPSSALRPG
jgi:hypothetical protein